MASLREGAPETEVRARVIEVATAHRLVTRYTSFVAVDKTPARPVDESLKTAAVPTLLPAGWEYDKVFGELPQGSTGSRLAVVLGLAALMLGALVWRSRT
jgi:Ca-activated chloride channel family protein